MKKILLLVIALGSSMGFASAQFVRNPASGTVTGLSFSGGTATTAGIANWGAFTPVYSNSTCTTYSSAYLGGAGATTSAGPKDTTSMIAYIASGVQNQFDNFGGATCYPNIPASFSFATNAAIGPLDLSSTANQNLTISIKSNVSFTIGLLLQTSSYVAINTNSQPPIHVLGDNTFHTYSLKFDTCVLTASKTSVANVAFVLNTTAPLNGEFYINNMTIGSSSTPCTATTLTPSFTSSSVGLTATLVGSNTGGTPAFQGWNFGDTTAIATTATASHAYSKSSTHTAKYIVYDACGVDYSVSHPVTVVAPTTAVSAAQANISSTKVYPNPVSDMVNVEMELKSSSAVKITLTDLMGKEVMTIANGNMSSLNESFSVANLNKGIYTVNYFINGSAAKAEMLMVK
jgi:hypothetical protein